MGGEGLGREDDGRGWEVMGGSYYLSLSLSRILQGFFKPEYGVSYKIKQDLIVNISHTEGECECTEPKRIVHHHPPPSQRHRHPSPRARPHKRHRGLYRQMVS